MTGNDFKELVRYIIAKIGDLIEAKGFEYAGQDPDRLGAFKRAAKKAGGKSPEEVLQGYMLKHDVSIDDMIREVSLGLASRPLKVWEEKIIDRIIYNILLLALIKERQDSEGIIPNTPMNEA